MKPGLYDQLVTRSVGKALAANDDLGAERERLGEAAPHVMARHIFDALVKALRNVPEEERAEHQRKLTNDIIELIAKQAPTAGVAIDDEGVDAPAEMLLAIRKLSEDRLGTGTIQRPMIPLRQSDLLVNGPRDLRVGHEVCRELASANAVDVIVSFVKWTGIRTMHAELREFSQRNPGRLRLLTTTYMGATEPDAIQELIDLGAQVRVSYDSRRTRLHAKAWLFHRDSGFSTGLVGSSNISAAALLDGCEWNVRLSAVDNRTILDKFIATFDQYWGDPAFEPYDRERFIDAATYRDSARDDLARAVKITPFAHQTDALAKLANERAHGHNRNLVIAATGTGKTVVAALDYVRLKKDWGGDPTLLFIAHREEILAQSLAKYRAALGDGHFGELLVGKHEPRKSRHVFASIQAMHADRLAKLAPDAFDVLVIDEFHHAAADSYTRLLDHLKPKVLLGLTATPERTDGKSILHWFDQRVAAELRLWDALDLGLVVPFQYFGVHDNTDLSTVAFNAGRYDLASLEQLYTADHVRANAVLRAVVNTIKRPDEMRAIGFCVSVAHAKFMARFFTEKGLPSLAVDSESSSADRAHALQSLRTGTTKIVFVKDLFNEGLDIPNVDTVLFLRPTESATIFLQQLGRGLRHDENKACLTVLDFIGHAHKKFRFVDRFRALTRGTRAEVQGAIEDGFPRLPAGCEIRLDRESQAAVLANVKSSVQSTWRDLADDLRAAGNIRMPAFLAAADLDPEQLYAGKDRTFAALRHRAGFTITAPDEDAVLRAVPRLLYIDDDLRLEQWRRWLASEQPPNLDLDNPLLLMMFVTLGFVARPVTEMEACFGELWSRRALREEIVDLLDVLADRPRPPTYALDDVPFRVHATYSRDEISAGLLQIRNHKLMRTQGGVLKCEAAHADILYVELDKDPDHYTPTTMYDDRPITPSRFQWESQSRTRADSDTGRRYQRSKTDEDWKTLLFVRQRADDARGFTSPYRFLGRVRYVSHEGEKPMRIMWALDRDMPADFFADVKIAAG